MIYNVFKNTYFFWVLIFLSGLISCKSQIKEQEADKVEKAIQKEQKEIIVSANNTASYLPLLKGKNIAIVANQTSVIFKEDRENTTEKKTFTHLVDSLIASEISIKKVFSPEHGFRGKADAGEIIADGKDIKTNLPLISLYGKNKKPTAEQLKDLDIVVFDIQDVGVRFYTYISTLHYVMEACAEAGIPLIVLDRPNPNGHYIDGPTLEIEHKSFVGMHPVPVVYGMTIGEYAQMINGEKWLSNKVQCNLVVIPVQNYTHQTSYSLPIKPSPNLPNDKAINLYPSLCFFEGTNVSVGRGTDKQFQVYGSPFMAGEDINYCFTPKSNEGATYPKHQDIKCCGFDLRDEERLNDIHLGYLIESYATTLEKGKFFNEFFTKLSGTNKLQQQIEKGYTEEQIKETWQKDLEVFKKVREKYLIYD